MIRKVLCCMTAAVMMFTACCHQETGDKRWTVDEATKWYDGLEWPVGCNYVPSYAINPIEMWQEESFDPKLIDHELSLAEGLGFNTVRMYLHNLMWEWDKEGFKSRIDQFLEICDSHGIKVTFTLFTNGGNYNDPKPGRQPDAVPGIHSSQWIQSPGAHKVNDPSSWPALKEYVQDILKTYGDDDRILYWCLYNEPENYKNGAKSLGLLEEVFKWAREVDPSQPCTAPVWIRPGQKGASTKMDVMNSILNNVDIITIHCYYDNELETFIDMFKPFGRPIICQEYMGRPRSTFEGSLPILKREKVGAINWGLVRGKCNFHLPWSSKEGDPDPEVWFHDIYNPDDTPYNESEIAFIRQMTGVSSKN